MERRGECNNCGWCCQFIMIQKMTVPSRDVTPDSTRFYEMRGGVRSGDGKIRVVMHSFMPCVAHDQQQKRCHIYAERPQICQNFPTSPDQIEGTPCTFWFEYTDADGKVECRGGLDSPHPTPPRF